MLRRDHFRGRYIGVEPCEYFFEPIRQIRPRFYQRWQCLTNFGFSAVIDVAFHHIKQFVFMDVIQRISEQHMKLQIGPLDVFRGELFADACADFV